MVSKTYPFALSMLKVTFMYDQIINMSHENNILKKKTRKREKYF